MKEAMVNIKLNMPPCSLQTRTTQGECPATEIFDIVRRKWVANTPEEWVRQHVVHTLIYQMKYPLELIQIEGSITLNRMNRRCDIVIYNQEAKPVLIVECKRPNVSLTQKVIDQICRYNLVLQVPYLYLTNGLQHLILRADLQQQQLHQLPNLPGWDILNNN